MAVVVVVGGASALAPSGASQAGLNGHILETKTAQIAIQVAGGVVLAFESGGVHQENIHEPVIVVIEDDHARARGLDDVLLPVASAGDVFGGQARLHGDIAEIHRDGRHVGANVWRGARGSGGGRHALKGAHLGAVEQSHRRQQNQRDAQRSDTLH